MISENNNYNTSWYIHQDIVYPNQKKYINDIQTIFKVLDPEKQWVPYILQPHQVDWHLNDVVLKGHKAKTKIVIKSRNTSFTVSSIITILMSVPFYPHQVIPVVRLNQTRAIDLVNEIKEIIKHMNVIQEEDGSYFPFNPKDVNMEASGSIKFPNGVEIRAFPASNSAAETIRGLRIAGCAGLIDECNFMKDFMNIYIAMRDASSGSIGGRKEFQVLIGTTRKGRSTTFNIWFEEIEKQGLNNIKIYKWPVFDPMKVDLNIPFTEQNLKPIVKWHDINDLENKRRESLNRFKEEYMAMLVDADDTFYEFYVIKKSLEIGEKYKCVQLTKPEEGKEYYIGIDVASGVNKDYFVISIFEKISEHYLQCYLNYSRDKELPQMEEFCINLIEEWNPKKVRIDSVGNGTQISQKLLQLFGPNIIEPLKGNMSIKGVDRRIPLSLNEFAHTNLKELMAFGFVGLINDEKQLLHFTAWTDNFKAESGVLGHGDIVIANMFAVLPDKWKLGKGKQSELSGKNLKQPEETRKEIETDIMKRVEWYKKQSKRQYR